MSWFYEVPWTDGEDQNSTAKPSGRVSHLQSMGLFLQICFAGGISNASMSRGIAVPPPLSFFVAFLPFPSIPSAQIHTFCSPTFTVTYYTTYPKTLHGNVFDTYTGV